MKNYGVFKAFGLFNIQNMKTWNQKVMEILHMFLRIFQKWTADIRGTLFYRTVFIEIHYEHNTLSGVYIAHIRTS